jgi:hypothetical protein
MSVHWFSKIVAACCVVDIFVGKSCSEVTRSLYQRDIAVGKKEDWLEKFDR